MTPSEKKAREILLRRLEEVLHNWGRRAIGHTYAMLRGTKADCYFVVLHEAQAQSFMQHGIDRKRIITEDCLPEALHGINKPVLVDHAVMARLIRCSLDDAERRGFERAKELAASLILNDGYAITFQTMGQYRTAIAKNVRSLTYDEA